MSKSQPSSRPYDVACSLMARTYAHMKADPVGLAPLGAFDSQPVDAVWQGLEAEALARGGLPHLGEVVGDVLQAKDVGARKLLAFCQAPGFVVDLLLDIALEPALATFGLHNVGEDNFDEGRMDDLDQRIRILDPSCGTGHILLRAARRIAAHVSGAPAGPFQSATPPEAITHGVSVVSGYDINPEAAAIARSRLALDLLVAGRPSSRLAGREWEQALERAIDPEGAIQVRDSLLDPGGERFEVVVSNPPFIMPRDPIQRQALRDLYVSASGKFGLHGPFTEATIERWLMPRGFCATIISNNFMKRSWGASMVEKVLAGSDLRVIVDTSGAYLPGFGTPTVILGIRGAKPDPNRSVLTLCGLRGEPTTPPRPEQGAVWSAIRAHTAAMARAMVGPPMSREQSLVEE